MRSAPSSLFTALLLAGAAVAHGAEPAGGALDQTKQELRQLQNDQKTKTGQSSEKARLSTPTLEVRPSEDSAESWLSNKQTKERKVREGRASGNPNWLAEGVEKLEKEEAQAKTPDAAIAKEPTTKENSPRAVDQSDPQYLLKLFDEQKKAGDPKPGAAKTSASTSPDPFAPFMESWLGSSPARGQFFDQSIKKSDATSANLPAGGAGDYRRQTTVSSAAMAAPEAIVAEKSNPYLTDLGAPVLTKEIVAETSRLQSFPGMPAPVAETSKSGPLPPPTGQIKDNRERTKGPPPGLTDDKKYFPQLKRF